MSFLVKYLKDVFRDDHEIETFDAVLYLDFWISIDDPYFAIFPADLYCVTEIAVYDLCFSIVIVEILFYDPKIWTNKFSQNNFVL